jgi:uncharacterized protein YbjT (DUF2867 family)
LTDAGGGGAPGRTALVLGASGLVGGCCLDLLLEHPAYGTVRTLGRRPLGRTHPKLEPHQVDFERLADFAGLFEVDDVFCALGTTMAAAGSQEAFQHVDRDYVVEAARLASERGAEQFLLVSALGADPSSLVFYNRVKGETEVAVKQLPFRALWIVRPSLLRGERAELRVGERLADWASRPFGSLLVGRLRRYRPVEGRDVAEALVSLALDEGTGGVIESEGIAELTRR